MLSAWHVQLQLLPVLLRRDERDLVERHFFKEDLLKLKSHLVEELLLQFGVHGDSLSFYSGLQLGDSFLSIKDDGLLFSIKAYFGCLKHLVSILSELLKLIVHLHLVLHEAEILLLGFLGLLLTRLELAFGSSQLILSPLDISAQRIHLASEAQLLPLVVLVLDVDVFESLLRGSHLPLEGLVQKHELIVLLPQGVVCLLQDNDSSLLLMFHHPCLA